MRRLLRPFTRQTPGEKLGMVDGTNLFFGALLGANLGTLEALPLLDYAVLIVILAGTVVTLRQFSTSERRLYAYGLLGTYVVLIAYFLYGPGDVLDTLPARDRDRLAVTLGVWLGAILLAESVPTRPARAPVDPSA